MKLIARLLRQRASQRLASRNTAPTPDGLLQFRDQRHLCVKCLFFDHFHLNRAIVGPSPFFQSNSKGCCSGQAWDSREPFDRVNEPNINTKFTATLFLTGYSGGIYNALHIMDGCMHAFRCWRRLHSDDCDRRDDATDVERTSRFFCFVADRVFSASAGA